MSFTFSTKLTKEEKSELLNEIYGRYVYDYKYNQGEKNFRSTIEMHKCAIRSILTYIYDIEYRSPFKGTPIYGAFIQLQDKIKAFYTVGIPINTFEEDYDKIKLSQEEEEWAFELVDKMYDSIDTADSFDKNTVRTLALEKIQNFKYDPNFKLYGLQSLNLLMPFEQIQMTIFRIFKDDININTYYNEQIALIAV